MSEKNKQNHKIPEEDKMKNPKLLKNPIIKPKKKLSKRN